MLKLLQRQNEYKDMIRIRRYDNYFSEVIIPYPSLTCSSPMTDARLRSDCLGLNRHRLLRGVAPLRRGESGGSRLSNNSGVR